MMIETKYGWIETNIELLDLDVGPMAEWVWEEVWCHGWTPEKILAEGDLIRIVANGATYKKEIDRKYSKQEGGPSGPPFCYS